MLLATGWVSYAWRELAWEERLARIPRMEVADLLCWLEEQPSPVFQPRPRRWDRERSFKQRKVSGASSLPESLESSSQVDINRATVDEWDALPGFGPVLSARVVRYREALGGFVSVDQLHSVYGLDTAVISTVRDRLVANPTEVSPLCLDSISFSSLVRHPLFDAEQTRRILRAWGRGQVAAETFWERLGPLSPDEELWRAYLDVCEPVHGSEEP